MSCRIEALLEPRSSAVLGAARTRVPHAVLGGAHPAAALWLAHANLRPVS